MGGELNKVVEDLVRHRIPTEVFDKAKLRYYTVSAAEPDNGQIAPPPGVARPVVVALAQFVVGIPVVSYRANDRFSAKVQERILSPDIFVDGAHHSIDREAVKDRMSLHDVRDAGPCSNGLLRACSYRQQGRCPAGTAPGSG